jgi:hypothetical protein
VNADQNELADRILALEAKRVAAMVSSDLVTLDTLLADDLSYTHSDGRSDTKGTFLALIRERRHYRAVDFSNTEVVTTPGGTAVVVRGHASIRLEGTASYPVLFLDVWALRNGAWRLVAWQATRLPE